MQVSAVCDKEYKPLSNNGLSPLKRMFYLLKEQTIG